MLCLNLGCGPRLFREPWINADILEDIGSDVVMDIDKRWPWEDDTFDQIWANHVLEHGWDKLHLITELWRVSRPGAFVQVQLPIFSWTGYWEDPTHRSSWMAESFTAFQQGHPHHGALGFKAAAEFVIEVVSLRSGWELAWDLVVVKPGIVPTAEPRIAVPTLEELK